MTNTKVQDKIAKLLKLAANNPNDSEAAVAFAMASDLANRHALDLDAILSGDTSDDGPELEREVEGIIRKRVVQWKRASVWKASLANTLAQAHRCKSFKRSGYGGGCWVYGQPADVATVEYLYSAISKEVDRRAKAYVAADSRRGRREGTDYRLGMAHEIHRRMGERQATMLQEAKSEAYAKGGETALMRVNQVEIYVERVKEALTEYEEKNLNLKKSRGYTYRVSGAYQAGRSAGRSVNLGGNTALPS